MSVTRALLGGLSLVGLAPVYAQEREELAGLDAYVRASLEDWNLPGLAVAVVFEDELVFAQGFGVKELGRDDPIDAHTRFQIGSVSKGFGAAAIGALVDDELVGWDDPVVEHLPWFALEDPELTQQITIRDLLAHTSGMPAHAYSALAILGKREVAERARLLDNQGPRRTEYRYSNQAYGIADLVVEAVSEMSWGEWVEARIFGPLAMTDSSASPYGVWAPEFVAPTFLGTAPAGAVSLDDAPDLNLAMPHGVDREGNRRILPWQSYDNLQAAGSVVSTVVDMANWLRMHLNRGEFEGKQVLSEATVAELHAPQIAAPGIFLFADEGRDSYCLGWERETFDGSVYLSHGGGIFGFPAYVALLPELNAGVVVLANGSLWTPYYPHQEIVAWVFGRLLGLEERDWHAEVMAHTDAILARVDQSVAAEEAARLRGTRPSLPLAGYAGTYGSEVAGTLEVSAREGQLRLQFAGVGAFSGELEHWHEDVFRLYYDGGDGQAYRSSLATFELDATGRVIALDLGAFGKYRRAK